MQTEFWKQLCCQNQVDGLAGCLNEKGRTRHFYFGHTKRGDKITASTSFKVGSLGRWIKSLAAIRYCFLNKIDLTKTDTAKSSLLDLMHMNESAFEQQFTRLSGMDMNDVLRVSLTHPLYLNDTRLEKESLLTSPLSFSTLLQMLALGLSGRSGFITHGMIGALFSPEPFPGLQLNEDAHFGLIDSGTDFSAGFFMDIERRRSFVLMSDNPAAQPMIEAVLLRHK